MAGPARTSFSPSPPPRRPVPVWPCHRPDLRTFAEFRNRLQCGVGLRQEPGGKLLGGKGRLSSRAHGPQRAPTAPMRCPRGPFLPELPCCPPAGLPQTRALLCTGTGPPVLPLSTGGGGGGGASLDGEPLQDRPFLLSHPPSPGQHGPGSQEAPATLRNRMPLLLLEFSSSLLQGKPGGQSASPGACLGMTVTEHQEKGRPGPDLPLQV